jgi:hypothetical protein
VKRAIQDIETELVAVGKILPTKATTPISNGYQSELDQSNELDPRSASYYQGMIRVLRWACELGRIDILVSVSMLCQYLCAPWEGHLHKVFHIFSYLKSQDKLTLVFDDKELDFALSCFKKCDWGKFYANAGEAIPLNMPEAWGSKVV